MAVRRRARTKRGAKRSKQFGWVDLPDRELLDLRLCDLGIEIEGTWLAKPIAVLQQNLDDRDLRVRPSYWLGEEWFSPDGTVGVAFPFYLAHPRLMRLERKQMLEVEGGTLGQCMQLLRHEVGHAVQHAYRFHRRRRFRTLFGSSARPYPDYYRPNPASRGYVQHLPYWYAQAHPDEDFAETFAVWVTPGSAWRKRYAGWKALRKLEYVDELMAEVAGKTPPVRRKARVEPLSQLKITLREHYETKHERFGGVANAVFDQDLRRLFVESEWAPRGAETAAAFLRRNRVTIRHMVARGTGRHEYALDMLLKELIARCRELQLRAVGANRELLVDLAILLAARSVEYVYRGRDWHAM